MYVQAFILTFIEALCCKIFFETFWDKYRFRSVWVNRILFLFIIAGFMTISFVLTSSYSIKAAASIALIAGIMHIQYQGNKIKKLFLAVIYYGMVICIDRIMLIVLNFVTASQAELLFHDNVKGTVIALLCKSLLFLCILFIYKNFKKYGDFALITDGEWFRFLFFPFITIVCMSAFTLEDSTGSNAMLVASFGLVLSNFLLFYMLRDVVLRASQMQEILLTQERIKSQRDIYACVESANAEQRSKIHEFKNHIECLEGLLIAHNYEAAVKYVNNINNRWINVIDYINTNHVIINSVLNQKYKLAKTKKIILVLQMNDLGGISVKLKFHTAICDCALLAQSRLCAKSSAGMRINIEDEDIVTLLANLLDNAIEAADKVTDKQRVIKIQFVDEQGKVTISVRNPVGEALKKEGNRILTSKANKKEHGIGIINIQNVVRKYNGESIYSCSNGYFTHSVIIQYK